jgi:hypothetical protein
LSLLKQTAELTRIIIHSIIGTLFTRHRLGSRILVFFLITAIGGYIFLRLGSELQEGDSFALDREILYAFRKATDSFVPVGPEWLKAAMSDTTVLGHDGSNPSNYNHCWISTRFAEDEDCNIHTRCHCRRRPVKQPSQIFICAPSARAGDTFGQGAQFKLSKRPCHELGNFYI